MFSSPKLRLVLLVVTIFCTLFGPASSQPNNPTGISVDYPPFGADDIALYKAFEASCSKFNTMQPAKQLHSNPIYGTAGQCNPSVGKVCPKRPISWRITSTAASPK